MPFLFYVYNLLFFPSQGKEWGKDKKIMGKEELPVIKANFLVIFSSPLKFPE